MKRLFDLITALILAIILCLPFIFIAILIRITSQGSFIFWSDRVGKNNVIFKMPKFRTMLPNSPNIASHLLEDPDKYLSPIGGFLRRTSLDEIPQIYSVLKGDMSFVGPRPALFNQYDLIELRKDKGVDKIPPGITGWAQVNGRDELQISDKVALDEEYLMRTSFWFDLKIIKITISRVIMRNNVSH